MSRESIGPCIICSRSCDTQISPHCSAECKAGSRAVATLGELLLNSRPALTPHIYFYDFAFGDLCDLFTTYLIRRIHTEELQKQRTVDRALERIERAVTTKLNKWAPVVPIRLSINKAILELYKANVRIWNWKDKYWHNTRTTPVDIYTEFGVDEWNEFMAAYSLRDAKRRELDRLVEGTTMTDKTYDQSH